MFDGCGQAEGLFIYGVLVLDRCGVKVGTMHYPALQTKDNREPRWLYLKDATTLSGDVAGKEFGSCRSL